MANSEDNALSTQSSLININSASREELQTIHGIGPLLSSRIIEYRNNVGAIIQKDQMHAIKGMRANQIESMENLIDWSLTVPGAHLAASSALPGVILSASALFIGLYLIYPMIDLFLEEFGHWENNLQHWYTTLVNLLAIVFTMNVLVLTLIWLLSLFYARSRAAAKAGKITLVSALSSFVLLITISAGGYFLLESRTEITSYMVDLLVVVVGVLTLIYLQYLPQLLYLGRPKQLSKQPIYYDYSLIPLAMIVLLASLIYELDSMLVDVFLLWSSILLFISGLTLVQKRSCFAELLQDLSGWPNIMQSRGEVVLQLGHLIRKINEERSSSKVATYMGVLLLTFSLGAASYNLYKLAGMLVY